MARMSNTVSFSFAELKTGLHTLKKVWDTIREETENEVRTAPTYTPRPDSHPTQSASVDQTPYLRRPEPATAHISGSTVVRSTQHLTGPQLFDKQPRFPGEYSERTSRVSIHLS